MTPVLAKIPLILAGFAGKSLRYARYVPGFAGAGLLSYGAALIYLPAGVILGGVLLLCLDWKL